MIEANDQKNSDLGASNPEKQSIDAFMHNLMECQDACLDEIEIYENTYGLSREDMLMLHEAEKLPGKH